MSEELKEIILGYCSNCNEYFWDFGETKCPNKCGSKYEKINFREIKKNRAEIYCDIINQKGKNSSLSLKWFKKIIDEEYDKPENEKIGAWADHTFSIKDQLFCEPYDLSDEELKKLQRFCDYYNLDFNIFGFSTHAPTCFTIIISKRG